MAQKVPKVVAAWRSKEAYRSFTSGPKGSKKPPKTSRLSSIRPSFFVAPATAAARCRRRCGCWAPGKRFRTSRRRYAATMSYGGDRGDRRVGRRWTKTMEKKNFCPNGWGMIYDDLMIFMSWKWEMVVPFPKICAFHFPLQTTIFRKPKLAATYHSHSIYRWARQILMEQYPEGCSQLKLGYGQFRCRSIQETYLFNLPASWVNGCDPNIRKLIITTCFTMSSPVTSRHKNRRQNQPLVRPPARRPPVRTENFGRRMSEINAAWMAEQAVVVVGWSCLKRAWQFVKSIVKNSCLTLTRSHNMAGLYTRGTFRTSGCKRHVLKTFWGTLTGRAHNGWRLSSIMQSVSCWILVLWLTTSMMDQDSSLTSLHHNISTHNTYHNSQHIYT